MKKKQTKNTKKTQGQDVRNILILILSIVLIVCIVFYVQTKNKQPNLYANKNEYRQEYKNKLKEELYYELKVKPEEDKKKLEEQLEVENQLNEKLSGVKSNNEIEISQLKITKQDEKDVVTAQVKNITNATLNNYTFSIVFVNESGSETYEIKGNIQSLGKNQVVEFKSEENIQMSDIADYGISNMKK